MAIAFARVSIHTRSKGHSAIAAAAYRSGTKLYDERTGTTSDFTNKKEVRYANIMLPADANLAFQDRETLWNAVEAAEKRINSQLCKDHILALPKELSLEQQIQLARKFSQDHFVRHGLVADIAIHDHGDGNPHAHILTSTRRLRGNKFAEKARDLNPGFAKGHVVINDQWSDLWNDYQEHYFKENDIDLSVDAKHILPQMHQGANPNRHYIRAENEQRRAAEVEIALTDPASIINAVSSQKAVFTDKDIAKCLLTNTDTREQFQAAYAKALACDELISLGKDDESNALFATKSQLAQELLMQDQVSRMKRQHGFKLTQVSAESHLGGLNNGQQNALRYLSRGANISLIIGQAGSGKSFLMRSANQMWVDNGYRVRGISVSGKAAKGLQESSEIPSRTLASLKLWLQKSQDIREILSSKDILVMDEAGMTNAEDMAFFVDVATRTGCKLVLVGDEQQLQPIGAGAPFRAINEQIGHACLDEILRQKDPADRVASEQLAQGDVMAAMNHYESKGSIHLADHESLSQLQQALVQRWSEGLRQDNLDKRSIYASDGALTDLNRMARSIAVAQGIVSEASESYAVCPMKQWPEQQNMASEAVINQSTDTRPSPNHASQAIKLSSGDRIVIRGEDGTGQCGTVKQAQPDALIVQIDGKADEITIDPHQMPYFNYGYAINPSKVSTPRAEQMFNSTCLSTVSDWADSVCKNPAMMADHLMLGHRNIDVDSMNLMARDVLKKEAILEGEALHCQGWENQKLEIMIGERLIMRSPDRHLGIVNGDFGTVTGLKDGRIQVKLDEQGSVEINPEKFKAFSYAYATTVYKAQGASINHTYVCANGKWDKYLAYVAMTRHKESAKVHASKYHYGSTEQLKKWWSQGAQKDNVLDYPVHFGRRRGMDTESLIERFAKKTLKVKQLLQNVWAYVIHSVRERSVDHTIKQSTTQRRYDDVMHQNSTDKINNESQPGLGKGYLLQIQWGKIKNIKDIHVESMCHKQQLIDSGIKDRDHIKRLQDTDLCIISQNQKSMSKIKNVCADSHDAIMQRAHLLQISDNKDIAENQAQSVASTHREYEDYRQTLDWKALEKVDSPTIQEICEINKSLDAGYSDDYNRIAKNELDNLICQVAKNPVIENSIREVAPDNLNVIRRVALHVSMSREREISHDL